MPITIYPSYIKFNDNNTYRNVMAMAPNLTFTNTLVSSESFTSDQTYADYPYRASIPLSSVTSSLIPEIIFGLEDSTSGIFAPIGETYNGGVYIYATKIPENSITIPTIICRYA